MDLKNQKEAAKLELKKLTSSDRDVKKLRDNAMKDMEKAMKSSQANFNAMKGEAQKLRNRKDSLSAELKAISEEATSTKDQVKVADTTILKLQKELDSLQKKVLILCL